MSANASSLLAAVVLAADAPAELLFDAVITKVRSRGARVGGYIQRACASAAGHDTEVVVEDIETGETFVIMQPRGGAGAGCRLDPGALADVVGRALVRLDRDMDLLVLNRFGRTETEGSGLRAVYEKAMARGLPVLTSVKPEHVEAWKAYTGDMSILLQAEEHAVCDWCRAALVRSRPAM